MSLVWVRGLQTFDTEIFQPLPARNRPLIQIQSKLPAFSSRKDQQAGFIDNLKITFMASRFVSLSSCPTSGKAWCAGPHSQREA